jgi:hypothetical protein
LFHATPVPENDSIVPLTSLLEDDDGVLADELLGERLDELLDDELMAIFSIRVSSP